LPAKSVKPLWIQWKDNMNTQWIQSDSWNAMAQAGGLWVAGVFKVFKGQGLHNSCADSVDN
jgi:hypothetical protein